MNCQICGTEIIVKYRPTKHQFLCPFCDKKTPRKMNRDNFDKKYWGRDYEQVPKTTRRDFYSDYLSSDKPFEEYKKATTES